MNILDVFALCVIAGFAALCFKRGFLASVLRLCSTVVSLAAACMLYPVVGRLLRATALHSWFYELVKSSLNLEETAVDIGLRTELFETIRAFPIPSFIKGALSDSAHVDSFIEQFNVTNSQDYIATFLANLFLSALALLLVFALVFAALEIIQGVTKIVTKLPVIKQFDKLAGAAVGLAEGALVVWLLFSVTSILLSLSSGIGPEVTAVFDASLTAKMCGGSGNPFLQALINSVFH